MKNYIKASPDEYGFYTDEELEDLRQQREDFYRQRKYADGRATDLTYMNDRFDELNIDVRTKEGLGSDYWYHKLLKSQKDVEHYDFHSDYWGSDYEYRENAEEIMDDIAVYIDTPVILDETGTPVKLLGLLVDKQYSGHLDLLVEPIKDVNSSKKIRSSKKARNSKMTKYVKSSVDGGNTPINFTYLNTHLRFALDDLGYTEIFDGIYAAYIENENMFVVDSKSRTVWLCETTSLSHSDRDYVTYNYTDFTSWEELKSWLVASGCACDIYPHVVAEFTI